MNRNKLPEEWKVLKFKDCIVQLSTGLNPRKNFSLGHGSIRYITAKNLIGRGEIDFSTSDYIDAEAKKIINKRSKIKTGDVLFSSRAPIGQTYLISTEPSYFDIGESIFSIRANKEVITPEYLCLYLSSDYFVKSASKHVTGSVIQEIRIGNLMETEIVVPPIEMQIRIAECINSIDYKIQLNNRINKKLESMSKTIYDYWFLQFEFPNENGKPYKSSGGKMVWNDELKQEIPEGWNCGNIASLISDEKSGDWGKETLTGNYSENVYCIRGADFPASTGHKDMNAPERWILEKNKWKELDYGDILIEISGGSPTQSTGRVCYINNNYLQRFNKPVITSNFCRALSLKTPEYYSWFYLMWKTLYENDLFFNYESKTTGLKNLLFDTAVNDIKIPLPEKQILNEFAKKINPFYENIQFCCRQNKELANLRDFLLPMLMNGQVTFKA